MEEWSVSWESMELVQRQVGSHVVEHVHHLVQQPLKDSKRGFVRRSQKNWETER